MPSETPEGHFEHPDPDDPLWLENGYVDPDGNEQTYDGIIDWLEQLEIRLTGIVPSRSELPAPDPDKTDHKTGNERIYAVRADRTIRRDTGTEWEAIAGRGTADQPAPPTWVEALGDVQYPTDLSEAQQIIDNADGNGVAIQLPAGTHTGTLTLRGAEFIAGHGNRRTTIDPDGGNAIHLDRQDFVDRPFPVHIRDLRIMPSGTPSSGHGIFIQGVPRCQIVNVRVEEMPDHGVVLRDGVYMAHLENVQAFRNTDGIVLEEGPDSNGPNGTKILNGSASHNANYGIRVETGAGISINSYAQRNSGKYAILVGGTRGISISGAIEDGALGLSPRDENLNVVNAATVEGLACTIGDGGAGIITGKIEDVDLTGNSFYAPSSSSGTGTAGIIIDQPTSDISIGENERADAVDSLVDAERQDGTSGTALSRPRDLNNGVWNTKTIPFSDIVNNLAPETGATTRGLTVEIAVPISDSGVILNTNPFPYGSVFKGTGKDIELASTNDDTVRLNGPRHTLQNLTIRSDATNGRWGIRVEASQCTVENVRIAEAANSGIVRPGSSGGAAAKLDGVTCISGNIGGTDIDASDTDGWRIVGCDAAVDSTNATNIATAANVDTL